MSKLLQEIYNGALRPEILEKLKLYSGKIVACDPLIPHSVPFERSIAPGEYPVVAWWNDEEDCIAAVELKFSESQPVRWEMATKEGQRIKELEEGHIYGYPVDTGLGCFADLEAIIKMDELETKIQRERGEDFISFYDDVLDDLLTENNDTWCNLIVSQETALNVMIFRSGYGDGFYASYWGFDEGGNIVSIVTDFNIL